MAEPPPALYHVEQQVACLRGEHLLVGTVLQTHWTGRTWQYQVRFGEAWEDWIGEADINGVQGTLFDLTPEPGPPGVGDCRGCDEPRASLPRLRRSPTRGGHAD